MKYHIQITMALFIGLCLIMLPPVNKIMVDATERSDINLELSSEGTLFEVDNMKPGDWATRTVTVRNTGNKSFDYQVKLNNTSKGSLFNELQLEVDSQNKTLYSGRIADFEEIQSNLLSKEKEDLQMTIRFPGYLGNDFQGMTTSFSFMFTAEGEENGQDKVGISGMVDNGADGTGGMTQLPKTATTIFNYLLIGALIFASGLLLAVYDRKRNNQMLN